VFERFTGGSAATVVGALLLILGGVVVVAHGGLVGTTIAFAGCLIVVRDRMRQRRTPPPD
jgi:hypothetical protein